MLVSYKKLWKLLIDKDIRKCDLSKMAGVSSTVISKLRNNQNVNIESLARLCIALNCSFNDIMEICLDNKNK